MFWFRSVKTSAALFITLFQTFNLFHQDTSQGRKASSFHMCFFSDSILLVRIDHENDQLSTVLHHLRKMEGCNRSHAKCAASRLSFTSYPWFLLIWETEDYIMNSSVEHSQAVTPVTWRGAQASFYGFILGGFLISLMKSEEWVYRLSIWFLVRISRSLCVVSRSNWWSNSVWK